MSPLTATLTRTSPASIPLPDTTPRPSAPLAPPPPLPPLPPLPLSGPPLPAGEGAGGEVSDALDNTVDALGYTPRDRRSQIWQRFCDGLSLSAIARDLGLDRQTVSRHVHAIQAELAADDRAFARLALLQAVHSQLALQTAALTALRAEVAIEDDYRNAYGFAQESAVATAKAMGAVHPDIPHATGQAHSVQQGIEHGAHAICTQAPYRAQRARLLSVASTAAWRAALLLNLVPRTRAANAPSAAGTPSSANDTPPAAAPDEPSSPPAPVTTTAPARITACQSPVPDGGLRGLRASVLRDLPLERSLAGSPQGDEEFARMPVRAPRAWHRSPGSRLRDTSRCGLPVECIPPAGCTLRITRGIYSTSPLYIPDQPERRTVSLLRTIGVQPPASPFSTPSSGPPRTGSRGAPHRDHLWQTVACSLPRNQLALAPQRSVQ